jgi:hypothetical protein
VETGLTDPPHVCVPPAQATKKNPFDKVPVHDSAAANGPSAGETRTARSQP